jgi:C_GCAxxG_C_C family probable redox protein
VLAVGERLWGQVDEQVCRMASGLSGGVGGTRQELCGALSGGALVIGAIHGRTRPDEDDSLCRSLVARYRERFEQEFGSTCCQALRDSGYGSDGTTPCSVLVEQVAHILLETLPVED